MRELVRYLFKMFCMAVAVSASFLVLFGFLLFGMDHRADSLAGTNHHKIELLQQTESPRIVLVGGSSYPYGTNCQMIIDALGVPTINVGATVYQGLDFYLAMLETYAVKGDIIVFAPEQQMLRQGIINYELVWSSAGDDWDVWRFMPLSYYPGLFTTGMQYYNSMKKLEEEGVVVLDYHRQFGPLGDVVEQRTNIMPDGYRTEDPISLAPAEFSKQNLKKIERFVEKMQKRGVTVLYAFAPLNEKAVVSDSQQIAAFEQMVAGAVQAPVVLSMDCALMEAEYFYDTNNHLNTAGAAIYTQNLIEGLRPYIQ